MIALGNLSTKQMCERLGIECTDAIAEMEKSREVVCDKVKCRDKWHCYDIPFEVHVGSKRIADEWYRLLSPFEKQMKCSIRFLADYGETE